MTFPSAPSAGSAAAFPARRSVFAGVDVCQIAGLQLKPGAPRPVFEQNVWDLTGLADAHRMVKSGELVWDFTKITNGGWQVVAKEVLLAMLAPQHERVLQLPRAFRIPRSPRTCYRFLQRLTEWFAWLTAAGIRSLLEVGQDHCDRYLEERSWSLPTPSGERRRLAPPGVSEVVRSVQVLAIYQELLSTDGYRQGFTPWQGRPSSLIAGKTRNDENRTQPVPDDLLQPLLATSLFLLDVIGPHAVVLHESRAAIARDRVHWPSLGVGQLPHLSSLIEDMRADGVPLPAISNEELARRTRQYGRNPLSPLAWTALVEKLGARAINHDARQRIRPLITEVAAEVGYEKPLLRDAAMIARHDTGEHVPWHRPIADEELRILTGHLVIACLVVTAALTGMRSSELLEIEAGRHDEREAPGGGRRFYVAAKLIKKRRFGGVADEWVVVEEVHRALGLAERLLDRRPGEALFGTIDLTTRVKLFRDWLERTGHRRHWGLPEIPAGPVNARMLRRTLALSIAQRPGGLLAAKVHLKHLSVATTEGYAKPPRRITADLPRRDRGR